MGEFFDEGISNWVRMNLLMTMEKAYWHKFLIFTKQPQNIELSETYPDNVMIGVSVNLKKDVWRIDTLKGVDAALRCVSFEPIYEDLGSINLDGIDWIIIGAQTRPEIQPQRAWIESLNKQATDKGIAIYHKGNLTTPNIFEYPKTWKYL